MAPKTTASVLARGRWAIAPRQMVVLASTCLLLMLWLTTATAPYVSVRERAFDMIMRLAKHPVGPLPIIVDIDRAALISRGTWPWSREQLATLVRAVAAAGPQAIAVDVLLDGDDARSPAALAKRLAEVTGNVVYAEAAKSLTDGDLQFAEAIETLPVVLGVALDHVERKDGPKLRPVRAIGPVNASQFWQDQSVVAPPPILLDAAAGAGLIVMASDDDGILRRLPMIAIAGQAPVPGLSVELLRAVSREDRLDLVGQPLGVHIGPRTLPLNIDGMLRLRADLPSRVFQSLISAERVLADPGTTKAALAGRIVIIGSSSPEAGGLRPSADGDLLPSFAFHAAAYGQLAAGIVPLRPRFIERVESVAAFFGVAIATVAGLLLGPWGALATTAAVVVCWLGACLVSYAQHFMLVDPLIMPLGLLGSMLSASMIMAADTRRRESRVRQRFEQHLAPPVIAELVANPTALRLEGRVREITALFTDVEGFTALTERAAPDQLIDILDDYFDGVSQIVIDHGGMIDKIVGDGVHAIFNAPLDLAAHPRKAFACAIAIAAFSERYRQAGLAAQLGFGRTRIGLETGRAIVGDVGGRRKLDYTAHGNAVNAAARLEAANKELATTIAIGPGTAAHLPAELVRPVGRLSLRGQQGDIMVYSTWPANYSPAHRAAYLAAIAGIDSNVAEARAALTDLAGHYPGDTALQTLVARLAGSQPAGQ